MLLTTGSILSFFLYLFGTRQSELLIYLPSATMSSYAGSSSYEGSNARSYASVDPRESSSQVSSRATRSTDSLTIPRERHWVSGGSETSRVSDTRTANWVADRSLTGHDSGSTTSSRRSSQRSGHSHRSRPREYEGGTADFLRRHSALGAPSEYSSASQESGRSQYSGRSDCTIRPSYA